MTRDNEVQLEPRIALESSPAAGEDVIVMSRGGHDEGTKGPGFNTDKLLAFIRLSSFVIW